jgi:hypothetical protein
VIKAEELRSLGNAGIQCPGGWLGDDRIHRSNRIRILSVEAQVVDLGVIKKDRRWEGNVTNGKVEGCMWTPERLRRGRVGKATLDAASRSDMEMSWEKVVNGPPG